MGFERPALVIFHGDAGSLPAERMMASARVAVARRTAAAALIAGFEAVIVATDSPFEFERMPAGTFIDPDPADEPFQYSRRLRGIVSRYSLSKPAIMGSGSVPLLGAEELRMIVEQLDSRDPRFVTNNFFSADITAWTPGEALAAVGEFDRDNGLPRMLRDSAGLASVVLPRMTATQFDLDTPADLAILSIQESVHPEVRAAASGAESIVRRYRAFMPLLCDRTAQIVVAGRVGGSVAWQYLERETACRVRLFAEERGMSTAPAGYQAHSVLGFLLEEIGPKRFFERMALLGDGLVLDTRVIEAHLGLKPSREDRFQSDLFNHEAIEEPTLRVFTKAAAEAPIPVILGGQSLVSGGLMALNDIAWRENDRLMGLAP